MPDFISIEGLSSLGKIASDIVYSAMSVTAALSVCPSFLPCAPKCAATKPAKVLHACAKWSRVSESAWHASIRMLFRSMFLLPCHCASWYEVHNGWTRGNLSLKRGRLDARVERWRQTPIQHPSSIHTLFHVWYNESLSYLCSGFGGRWGKI